MSTGDMEMAPDMVPDSREDGEVQTRKLHMRTVRGATGRGRACVAGMSGRGSSEEAWDTGLA